MGLHPLIARCLFLAATAGLLGGCGIEQDVTYYSQPTFAYAGNLLTLRHNSDNNDSSFLGYDLYYRAFYSLSEATTARSTIESSTNSTTSTPESVESLLTSNGFKKIFLASAPTVTPTPVLPEGPNTYYIYLINENDSSDWYYNTSDDGTPVYIVRGTGNGESFNDVYEVGDVDYGSTSSGVGKGDEVYIDAFAVAYGYDFTTLSKKLSFPASLYEPIGASNGYTLP